MKDLTVLIPGRVHKIRELEVRIERIQDILASLPSQSFQSMKVESIENIHMVLLSRKSYCIEGKYKASISTDYGEVRTELSKWLYSELDKVRKYGSGVFIAFENQLKEEEN